MSISTKPSKSGLSDSGSPTAEALGSAFKSASINMSWQLAVVVLVLIFGGFKLDEATGHSPLFTLLGLVLAIGASVLIIRRAMQLVSNFNIPTTEHKEQK